MHPYFNSILTTIASKGEDKFNKRHLVMAVYNRWTGTVDWTSGLDYWTHRFVLKAH